MCGCLSSAPYWGPGLQPRHVPWLGIELATLWFAGQLSIHYATPVKVLNILYCSKLLQNEHLNFIQKVKGIFRWYVKLNTNVTKYLKLCSSKENKEITVFFIHKNYSYYFIKNNKISIS